MKIKIDPLFWPVIPLAAAFGFAGEIFAAAGATALHELGHIAAAARGGRRVALLRIMPVGVAADLAPAPAPAPAPTRPRARPGPALILAAGPAANILAAALTLGAQSIFPGARTYLIGLFAFANIFMAAFNLLPVLPLDGGRLLCEAIGRMSGYAGAASAMRTVSKALIAALLLLGILQLAGSGNNFSLLCVGIYLASLSAGGDMEAGFMNIRNLVFRHERLKKKKMLEARHMVALGDMNVADGIRRFDRDAFHFVCVLDGDLKPAGTLSEKDLLDCALSGDPGLTFADALKKCDNKGMGRQKK